MICSYCGASAYKHPDVRTWHTAPGHPDPGKPFPAIPLKVGADGKKTCSLAKES
jgi:hypothetical protein